MKNSILGFGHGIPPMRPPARAKLPHQELPRPHLGPYVQTDGPFWLAAYMISTGDWLALVRHIETSTKRADVDAVTNHALRMSEILLREDMERQLKNAKATGMLLYAWPGTTYFDQPQTAH